MYENCTGRAKKRKFRPQCKKKYFMNLGVLKHGLAIDGLLCRLMKMLEVSTLSFNVGRCMSQQRLPDSLENSRCRANRLESILCPLLKVLDVSDFCSINSRLQISPEIKIIRVVIRGRSRPCCCSTWSSPLFRQQVVQEFLKCMSDNRAQHHHAWTVKGLQSADLHFATALEGRSVGSLGKQLPV